MRDVQGWNQLAAHPIKELRIIYSPIRAIYYMPIGTFCWIHQVWRVAARGFQRATARQHPEST